MSNLIVAYLEGTYLGRDDFTGSSTASYLWEIGQLQIHVESRKSIESKTTYQRPITIEAEIKASESDRAGCISMTLFADDDNKITEISLEIGGAPTWWRFYPGNNRGQLAGEGPKVREYWRKVKLELDDSERVDFYIDNEHKYNDTSPKTEGKLRFVGGCTSMKIKNIKIGNYIKI